MSIESRTMDSASGYKRIAFLSGILFLTPIIFISCAADDLSRDAGIYEHYSSFRSSAEAFISFAQKDNTCGMVEITSLITIRNNHGADALKSAYRTKIAPIFYGKNIVWTYEKLIVDEYGNRGFAFLVQPVTGKSFKFAPVWIVVLQENSRYVVAKVLPFSQLPHGT